VKSNTGNLFKNYKKKPNSPEDVPSFTGEALVDGHSKKVYGWVKKTKNGGDYISLKFFDYAPPKSGKAIPKENNGNNNKRNLDTIAVSMSKPVMELDPDSIDLDNLPF
jgi:hypothetical protein